MDFIYSGVLSNIDGDWLVEFPSIPGAFGGGKTKSQACRNAAEALRLALASEISAGNRPPAECVSGEGPLFAVEVSGAYVADTALMTITQAAEALGVSVGRASQLASRGQLDCVVRDGRRLVTCESVSRRASEDHPAHRPRTALP